MRWLARRPGRFTPGKDAVPIVQEAGWAPGLVWTDAEHLAPRGIRFPDWPARSESLYRLRYPVPHIPGRTGPNIRNNGRICMCQNYATINFLINNMGLGGCVVVNRTGRKSLIKIPLIVLVRITLAVPSIFH
jgi:hypothetical protein